MRRLTAVVVLSCFAAVPAAALAQEDTTAPPQAATPKLALTVEKVGTGAVTLAGKRFRVRGVLTPAVAGEKVTIRVYRGTKKLVVRQLTLQPSKTGQSSFVLAGLAVATAGRITVRASHVGTAALPTVRAASRSLDVLPRRASGGRSLRVLQARLAKLGYVVGRRGSMDGRTQRAIIAVRKVLGMARNARADLALMRRLATGAGAFRVRFPTHGRHVEADISRQVMALIGADGKVERIYHISSGKPATPTILGSYRVYRKDFGKNAKGMVDSSYFIRGYAIHGYASVPVFNASHGCLRVPVPDALSIFRWVRIGTVVDTYR